MLDNKEITRAGFGPRAAAFLADGLIVFLALLFLAELGIAAFKYPGFLSKVRTVSTVDNPYVKVIDTSTENEAKQLLRASSPGNPANITKVCVAAVRRDEEQVRDPDGAVRADPGIRLLNSSSFEET